jgi:hypothetical protein
MSHLLNIALALAIQEFEGDGDECNFNVLLGGMTSVWKLFGKSSLRG